MLAIHAPVQLDHIGGVTKAATQAAVLAVVLLHLHHRGVDDDDDGHGDGSPTEVLRYIMGTVST